jgi:hypothetical protein
MTNKIKIKLISLNIILISMFFYIIISLDNNIFEMTHEEFEEIKLHHEKNLEVNLKPPVHIVFDQDINLGKELLLQLDEITKLKLLTIVSNEDIKFISILIKDMDIKSKHEFFKIFKYLSESDIKKLIYISEKLGIKKTKELIAFLLRENLWTKKRIIYLMFDMTLSNINSFLEFLKRYDIHHLEILISIMIEIDKPSKLIELLSLTSLENQKQFVDILISHDAKFVNKIIKISYSVSSDTAINIIKLFFKLDKNYRVRLINLLNDADINQMATVFNNFEKMNTLHIKRAIEMIEVDKRLLKNGVALANRLNKFLTNEEAIDTLERSINTGARVNKETRFEGTKILLNNVRDVAVRRTMKQLDGNKKYYTGNVVEQIVVDFYKVKPNNFMKMLTSSSGLIHGPYRNSQVVTQQRKLEVIEKFYSGNLKHKKDFMLKFYEHKPMKFDYNLENDFLIKEPEELQENKRF